MTKKKDQERPLGWVRCSFFSDMFVPPSWKVGDRVRSRAPLYRGLDGDFKPRGNLKHRGKIKRINGRYIYVLVNAGYEIEFYDVELERYR